MLPQHWLRTQPRTRWCDLHGWVTKWHEHHGRCPIIAIPRLKK
jgi:hypothetical protein